jgi:hypothetical protein
MVETRLRRLVTEMTQAQLALARARDAENEAKWARDAAYRRVILSGAAPRVARDGATAAERDAWVADRIDAEQVQYDRAAAAKEAAQDHLRTLFHQAEVVRSLGASVRQAYDLSGLQ